MQYEKYYQKTLKLANMLYILHRFRILIAIVLLAIIAMLSAFFALYGYSYQTGECPSEIAYGETIDYQSAALFTSVSYEYCMIESGKNSTASFDINGIKTLSSSASAVGVWTTESPKEVGTYKIRCVSTSIFGTKRYGSEFTFKINPKQITVEIEGNTITYGEMPGVEAELCYSDQITCTDFEYSDIAAESTYVTANKDYVVIYNTGGEDVSYNYEITECVSCLVSVANKQITITVDSVQKVYDGTALEGESYEITKGSLADGDSITSANLYGSITNTGTESCTLDDIVIKNSDGQNVSSKYDITIVNGTLSVTARPITIVTADGEWTYDAREHYNASYSVSENSEYGILDGHTVKVAEYAVTNATTGTQNKLSVTIFDGEDDVTSNYVITYDYGTLIVNPFAITMTSGSDSKVYDGDPLTCNQISAENLIDGHYYEATTSGSQTNAGESDNIIAESSIKIYDGNGNDVTANYSINYIYGKLTVTPVVAAVTALSGEKIYDGTPLTCEGATAEGLLKDHYVYSAETTGSQIIVGESGNTIVEGSVKIYDGSGNDVTENYTLSYYTGTLKVTKRDITITAGSDEKIYDATPLTCSDSAIENLVSGHTYTATIVGSQTEVGESSNTIDQSSVRIYEGEIDVTENYNVSYVNGTLTVKLRPITITAGSDQKVYDGTALTDAEYMLTSEYDVLSVHTLVAETSGSQTNVGTSENIINISSVKIYNSDNEDVSAKYYDITYINGALTVTQRSVTIKSSSDEWVYDGTDHYNNSYEVAEDSDYSIVAWQTVSVSMYIIVRNVTTGTQNEIAVEIYDGNDNVTENYKITYVYGTLIVNKRSVTIVTASQTLTYDGYEHSNSGYSISEKSLYDIVSWHTVNVVSSTIVKNVTEGTENKFELTIYDSDENVTDNYEITYEYGTLIVNKRSITFKTASNTWVYDGTEHYDLDYSGSGIVEFHNIEISEYTIVKNVTEGTSNVLVIEIYDGSENVSANYEINYEYGTLIVTKRAVILETGSNEWDYDGQEHYLSGVSVASGSEYDFVATHSVIIAYYTVVKNVTDGTENVVTVTISDETEDVTDNYSITYNYGTLIVKARQVTVISDSAAKDYDGTPLRCNVYTAENVVTGHTVEVTITGSQTEIGSSANTIESVKIFDGEEDVTSNYIITTEEGTLSIGIIFTVYMYSVSKIYDGTPLSYEDDDYYYETTSDEYSFVLYNLSSVSQTNAGTIDISVLEALEYAVFDSQGNKVTTGIVVLFDDEDLLTVYKRSLSVASGSSSKEYDGEELTNETWWISLGTLASGHTITINFIGSQTSAGTSENKFTITIYDANGNDVTDNYGIDYEYGTLEVTED